jgi:hypothetical protein
LLFMTDWQLTGSILPASLAPARREAHAAVQLIAAVGRSLLPPRHDDSHTSMSWSDELAGFVGEPMPRDGVRVGLRLGALVLCVVDAEHRPVAEYPLAGRTLGEARHWLGGALTGRVHSRASIAPIELPEALMAERQIGTPLVLHVESVELAKYYANANLLLDPWASAASPVRLWPHHFDIAVLLTGPKRGQTIGVGMSPGDSSYEEPYWYVTPWPYPSLIGLPPLVGGGEWHVSEWVGAVLIASATARPDAATQRGQVLAFIESAIDSARAMLDRAQQS